jgi:hypothetical protein
MVRLLSIPSGTWVFGWDKVRFFVGKGRRRCIFESERRVPSRFQHTRAQSIQVMIEDSEQCSSSTVTMLAHPAPDADSGSPCQAARAVRLPQPDRRRPVARAGLPVTAAGAGGGVRRSRPVSD